MSNAIERQVTVKGPLLKDEKVKGNQAVQVSVELFQKARSRAVSGEIRINDPAGNIHLETPGRNPAGQSDWDRTKNIGTVRIYS
ncbi:ribulose-5-phosphate 4-epimerase and related epimerases and aldolases [Bacillus sp. OxB-1]|nr:ribulose-5-phosphate 4-epimerase and related epimerases and aldolases [Bacillus sp. OxB-1]